MSASERPVTPGAAGPAVRPEDLVVAVLCLLVAGVTAAQAIPNMAGRQNTLGPGAYPTGLSLFVALCGLIQLVRAFRGGLAPGVPWPRGRSLGRVAMAFGSLVAYLYTMQWVGFWLGTTLFLLFQFRALGAYSWRVAVPMSLGLAFAIAYVFGLWLYLPLPRGVIGF
jgi:hypothetical protein